MVICLFRGDGMASGNELGMVTVVGMGIVFAVLIILALIIFCFRYIFKANQKSAVNEPEKVLEESKGDSDKMMDEELVAVIAAAIADTNPDMRFVVRSIVRLPDASSSWGRIAIQEQTNTRTGR